MSPAWELRASRQILELNKEITTMYRYYVRYVGYVLSALSTVAFHISAN